MQRGILLADRSLIQIMANLDFLGRNSALMGKQADLNSKPTELKRRVFFFLARRGLSSLPRLSIEVEGGTLTFRGTVPSFYERQLCLACHRLPGVEKLVDELKVEIRSSALA